MPTAAPFRKADALMERLLDDPIMDLLMARDGVTRAEIIAVIRDVRRSLRHHPLDHAA